MVILQCLSNICSIVRVRLQTQLRLQGRITNLEVIVQGLMLDRPFLNVPVSEQAGQETSLMEIDGIRSYRRGSIDGLPWPWILKSLGDRLVWTCNVYAGRTLCHRGSASVICLLPEQS